MSDNLPGLLESIVRDPQTNGVLLVFKDGESVYRSEQWLADVAVSTASNLLDGAGNESDAKRWELLHKILTDEELRDVEAVVGAVKELAAEQETTDNLHMRLPDGVVTCERTKQKFQVPDLRPSDAFDCPACGEHVRPSVVLS
jgi:hypothetical protein